jgi:hypothetical protein
MAGKNPWGSFEVTGATVGLEIKEFCRREEATVLDVRVGLVRVCRDEVRKFEVARAVVVEVAMTVEAVSMRRSLAGGGLSQSSNPSHEEQQCSEKARSSVREARGKSRHELINCKNGCLSMAVGFSLCPS